MLWIYYIGLAWFAAMLNVRQEMLTLKLKDNNAVAVLDGQPHPKNNEGLSPTI